MKITLTILCVIMITMTSSCFNKSEWTEKEVVEWYTDWGPHIRKEWKGLHYQGSDLTTHYFMTRSVDSFVFFEIPKSELKVPREESYSGASTSHTYYVVDPLDGFRIMKK